MKGSRRKKSAAPAANRSGHPNDRLSLLEQINNTQDQARSLKARYNESTPVWRLPNELLLMIFSELPRPTGHFLFISSETCRIWIAVTYVCSRWRKVALQSPFLWTTVVVSNPVLTGLFLSRSGSLPLSLAFNSAVSVSPRTGAWMTGSSLIQQSLEVALQEGPKRMRTIDLSLSKISFNTLKGLARSRAPILHSLSLVQQDRLDASVEILRLNLLCEYSPNLRTLRLSRIYIPLQSSLFKCDLTYFEIGFLPPHRRYDITELVKVLGNMPHLRNLVLNQSFASPVTAFDARSKPTISLPHLVSFHLNGAILDCCNFTVALSIPNKTSVSISFTENRSNILPCIETAIAFLTHWFKQGILQDASSETSAPSFPWIGIEEHSTGLQTAPLVINGGKLFKLVLNWPELPLAHPGYICKFLLRIVSVPAFKNTTRITFRSNLDYPAVNAATLRAIFRIVAPVSVAIYGTFLVDFAKAFNYVSKHRESTDGVDGMADIRTLWISNATFPSSDNTRTIRRFMEGLQHRTSAPNGKLRKLRIHCCTLTRAQMARIEGFPLEVCWDGKLNGCRRTTGQRESDWSANGDETEATVSTESSSKESDSDSDDSNSDSDESDSESDDSDEDSDDSDDSDNDHGDSGAEDGNGELDDADVEVDAVVDELNGTDMDSDGEEDFEDFFDTPLGQMTAYAYMTTSLLLLNEMDRDDELVWY